MYNLYLTRTFKCPLKEPFFALNRAFSDLRVVGGGLGRPYTQKFKLYTANPRRQTNNPKPQNLHPI